jgi:hypothetical protein
MPGSAPGRGSAPANRRERSSKSGQARAVRRGAAGLPAENLALAMYQARAPGERQTTYVRDVDEASPNLHPALTPSADSPRMTTSPAGRSTAPMSTASTTGSGDHAAVPTEVGPPGGRGGRPPRPATPRSAIAGAPGPTPLHAIRRVGGTENRRTGTVGPCAGSGDVNKPLIRIFMASRRMHDVARRYVNEPADLTR